MAVWTRRQQLASCTSPFCYAVQVPLSSRWHAGLEVSPFLKMEALKGALLFLGESNANSAVLAVTSMDLQTGLLRAWVCSAQCRRQVAMYHAVVASCMLRSRGYCDQGDFAFSVCENTHTAQTALVFLHRQFLSQQCVCQVKTLAICLCPQ